jgi:dephospho-CoA kinase
VVEAALMFEAGAETDFDKVVVVTCNRDSKVQRYARRTALSIDEARAEVDRRTAAQWRDEEKARRADYVIDNSGTVEDTERQVEAIWTQLQGP